MHQNQFTVTFEIVDARRVRVFVNDRAQGYVRLHDVRAGAQGYKLALTYRASSSPFKSKIDTSDYTNLAEFTVAELLTHGHTYRRVVAAVIRNYLFTYETADIALRESNVVKLKEAA